MKIKTTELSGLALNWAVGKFVGDEVEIRRHSGGSPWIVVIFYSVFSGARVVTWEPTESQHQAGDIIDRYGISTWRKHDGWWQACIYDVNDQPQHLSASSDRIRAAMLCFVRSKLGDEVDVPDELLK